MQCLQLIAHCGGQRCGGGEIVDRAGQRDAARDEIPQYGLCPLPVMPEHPLPVFLQIAPVHQRQQAVVVGDHPAMQRAIDFVDAPAVDEERRHIGCFMRVEVKEEGRVV